MDQVVAARLERVGEDVMAADLDRGPEVAEERVSMSVATTRPSAPTWSASQRATEPPPAPTSRHRHPGATPTARRRSKVTGS